MLPRRWLGPHRYSVSGIAVAVSDFAVFTWVAGLVGQSLEVLAPAFDHSKLSVVVLISLTVVALFWTLLGVRRDQTNPELPPLDQ